MKHLIDHSKTKTPIVLPKTKRCSCGRDFDAIPTGADFVGLIYWWHCQCRSTLTFVTDEWREQFRDRMTNHLESNIETQ